MEEKNIPIAQQSAHTFQTLDQVKTVKAQLGQKMHMDRKTENGVDSGDEYFHQGLCFLEQSQYQLLNLQCWIRDNVSINTNSPDPSNEPIKKRNNPLIASLK